MAEIVDMIRYSPPSSDPRKEAWQYEETLSTPGAGKWIRRPPQKMIMSAMLGFPGGGEGRIEAIISNEEDIIDDDPNLNFMSWPEGNVTVIAESTFTGVKAIRQVNISGTTVITVEA